MDRVYKIVTMLTRLVFASRGISVTVKGGEHIPAEGPALLASNHTSYLDFLFVGYYPKLGRNRFTRFMAKKESFDHRISGPLMRAMRHISVDRADGQPSLVAAIDDLRQGELVAIFPEGTMSESFELQEFKMGAARIALATGVPIIPIAVWGSHRIYCSGRKNFGRSKIPVVVNIGEPILPEGSEEELTAKIKTAIQLLLDQAQEQYPAPEGQWWVPAKLGGSAPTLAEAVERKAQRKAAKAIKSTEEA